MIDVKIFTYIINILTYILTHFHICLNKFSHLTDTQKMWKTDKLIQNFNTRWCWQQPSDFEPKKVLI